MTITPQPVAFAPAEFTTLSLDPVAMPTTTAQAADDDEATDVDADR